MSRLSALAPRFGALPARLATADSEGHSAVDPSGKWYHLARWKHPQRGLRVRVFVRDLFTCQWPGCGKLVADTSQLVADHKVPHRGDPRLFWDEANVWTLCKPHHDGAKQTQERRGRLHPPGG